MKRKKMNEMKNVVAVTVMMIALMAIIVPVSMALDDVKWECFATDEPITLGMEIIKMAETNPESGSLSFVCVPVDRNIGIPKSELVKCKCDIWSDMGAINFLIGDTRYIWAKDCDDIKHCDCTEVEYTLTLEHYLPYYKPGTDDPRRAGDLVATLADKSGNGVSGKKVGFFVEGEGAELDEVLVYHMSDDYPLPIPIPNKPDFPNPFMYPETMDSYIGEDYTNEKGIASLNYLVNFKSERFSDIVREAGRTVKGKIKVVVFDEKTWEIEEEASVNIELSSVARITNIKSLNTDDAMVRVAPVGSETGNLMQKVLPNQLPYELLCGDVVLLDESDLIDIHWLTGTKMRIRPKIGFLKENQLAKVHIGGRDAGWARRMSSEVVNASLVLDLGGSTFVVGAYSSVCGEIVGIPGMFIIGLAIGNEKYEPLRIECYSTILIDLDKTATVYTAEGTGRLHNVKDKSTTDVTTGHKISVSQDGTFSQVTKFDRSELNDDLSYLLESIEKDESDKQSKLEISKLYVGKSVYPRETEVDVHYRGCPPITQQPIDIIQ